MRYLLPYAPKNFKGKKCFVECPACQKSIQLTKKDFESFSMAAYAAHYEAEHVKPELTAS